jgi:hypothetical protein
VLVTVRSSRLSFAASTALALWLLPLPLRADATKDQCVEANARAQDLRRDGKLLAAADQLRLCSVPSCPAIVRDDCTVRLNDVMRVQPSMVFDVKDATGADLIAVRVSMDGQLLADHLDGKPLRTDPGAHTFRFEAAGKPPVERRLLVKEGEAGREEHVVISGAAAGPSPGTPWPETPEAAPTSSGLGTQRLIGLTVGGVGVVGVGLGAVFGLLASSAWSDAKAACNGDPSHCTGNPTAANSDHSTTETDAAISTIGFVAGGVLVAAGAVLFFTGHRREASTAPSVSVAPSVGPGQAGVMLGGVF